MPGIIVVVLKVRLVHRQAASLPLECQLLLTLFRHLDNGNLRAVVGDLGLDLLAQRAEALRLLLQLELLELARDLLLRVVPVTPLRSLGQTGHASKIGAAVGLGRRLVRAVSRAQLLLVVVGPTDSPGVAAAPRWQTIIQRRRRTAC